MVEAATTFEMSTFNSESTVAAARCNSAKPGENETLIEYFKYYSYRNESLFLGL